FMLLNLLQSQAAQVFKRRAQADGVGDIRRASLKLIRQPVINRLVESNGGNHVSAALVRWHGLQQFGLAVKNANSGRTINLVAGEGIEVAVKILYVHLHTRRSLRSVDQNWNVARVRHADNLTHR